MKGLTHFHGGMNARQRSFSEDEEEAEAYFKKYVTTTFHPDDKTADKMIRVIYPLVTQPPGKFITACTGAAIRNEGAKPSTRPLQNALLAIVCYVIPQSQAR
jgi:hypothetical protein